uniref:ethanolamine-phosphate cytidylyltransferase n=1 Tax=Neobodo designis TaxID=312471 RepID=A0A7S1PYR6_NEODS|mmetsp:Transcript_25804/g.79602  ORF Transcript_25804/g.79602 Transcript_25804/m.79602 type:complete len:494 (+) Transcript_25804:56-1537(+)
MTQPPMPSVSLIEHSFFFTHHERERIANLSVKSYPSILARLLRPMWWGVSKLIPETVAPNAIGLLGVVLSMQALQVVTQYYHDPAHARVAAVVAALLLLGSSWCSALDGVHAERCRTGTFLGSIFSEICHSMKHVFFSLSVLHVLGIEDLEVQWYTVMALQFARLAHTFVKYGPKTKPDAASLSRLFSSTELAVLQIAILAFPHYVPVDTIVQNITNYAWIAYWAMVVLCLVSAPLMRSEGTSLVPLGIVLLSRVLPSFILPLNELTQLSVIADATTVATLTIEVVLSSFAHRTIHSCISVVALLGCFNSILSIAGCVLYLGGVLLDLSVATKTPLFVPIRNVYIDGVYDLCHIGHKRLMEYALKHGNRLIVGVLSDEACVEYKRKPIMTTEERCTEVRSCRWVSQVISGAPDKGLTKEFLKKHNIHVVVYGEEYDTPTDHYYRAAREMGIGVTAPRTPGMSTSEIIRRIANADQEALSAKDKANPNKKQLGV